VAAQILDAFLDYGFVLIRQAILSFLVVILTQLASCKRVGDIFLDYLFGFLIYRFNVIDHILLIF